MGRLILPLARSGDEFKGFRIKSDIALFFGLIFATVLWIILRNFFFPEFKISSYWIIRKDFFSAILPAVIPLAIYGTINSLASSIFKSSELEESLLLGRSWFSKMLTSAKAGILEELSHRGVFIYFALIAVAITNAFWQVLIWILAGALIIGIMSAFLKGRHKNVPGIIFGLAISGILIFAVIKLVGIIPDNPFYRFNGLVLKIYQWLTGTKAILATFLGLITLTSFILIKRPLNAIVFVAWWTYALPIAIASMATAVIIPEGASHMTYLCYIGALFYINLKFREGHKYQGPFGMANSYFFGLFMCHLCFTYGLLYAIIAHFLYDAIIFSVEHAAWFIRNTRIRKK
jgi:hypothetical protein